METSEQGCAMTRAGKRPLCRPPALSNPGPAPCDFPLRPQCFAGFPSTWPRAFFNTRRNMRVLRLVGAPIPPLHLLAGRASRVRSSFFRASPSRCLQWRAVSALPGSPGEDRTAPASSSPKANLASIPGTSPTPASDVSAPAAISADMAAGPKKPPPPENTLSSLRQHLGLVEVRTDECSHSPYVPDPVFVSLDVEAYEFNQKIITEIGIAKLDSRELNGPPESSPDEWLGLVQAAHIIVQEARKYKNRRHVQGCPDMFMYGESEIIPLRGVPKYLKKAILEIEDSKHKGKTRNVILVGHGIANDLKYLSMLGLKLKFSQKPEILGLFDTQKISRGQQLPPGLGKLLVALGEEPMYLHNAGNDAAYTMRALLRMALYGHVFPEVPSMELARKEWVEMIAAEKARTEKARVSEEEKKASKHERELTRQAERARVHEEVLANGEVLHTRDEEEKLTSGRVLTAREMKAIRIAAHEEAHKRAKEERKARNAVKHEATIALSKERRERRRVAKAAKHAKLLAKHAAENVPGLRRKSRKN